MGIPSYFSYIVKNYPDIIKKYNDNLEINNLYLDCNSIIYDVYNKMDFTDLDLSNSISTNIIQSVIVKIEYYIQLIKPDSSVIIAFDGVAPVAKLEQQRSRRYKSFYQNQLAKSILKKTLNDPWNTASITPGTKFMTKLNTMVSRHFNKDSFGKYNLSNIIVSGSDVVGEGEHKLFNYIRNNPDKHLSENTVIYGLDADLIMLSINHLNLCPNIFLFRETPHFIQSIDNSLEPDSIYFLDIPQLSHAIIEYMNNDKSTENTDKIYDYIFLGFFLGNDFLPHFPAINIRTGGVDKMLNAYRATIKPNENLTNGKIIYWNNVRKLVSYLANLEEKFIITEHKTRNYKEKHNMPQTTPEEKLKRIENIPIFEREIEKYINPLKPNWQKRYYDSLFDASDNDVNNISVNYLQGLEWTMKYYTIGCPDWRWKYKYNYPPLLQDLIRNIPISNKTFVLEKPENPVSEIVQLCYVLPRTSLELLPEKLSEKLLITYDKWYKINCDFTWSYCKYFWESHVDMNEINIEELEQFIEDNKKIWIE